MEKKRPYWQVAVSLLFSILATVAFIFIGVKAVLFFMPFVVGWCIASIAVPVVNWLEKKFNIVKKIGISTSCNRGYCDYCSHILFCNQ